MPDLKDDVDNRQRAVECDEKPSPTPRDKKAVIWYEAERYEEKDDEAECRDPERRRDVDGVRSTCGSDDISACTADTEEDVEHRTAEAEGQESSGSEDEIRVIVGRTYQAAYDMVGAKVATVRLATQSARLFPTAKTGKGRL